MPSSRTSLLGARDKIPEDVRKKWRAAFGAIDVKNVGSINAEALSSVMRSMGMLPQRGEVDAMIGAVDRDGDESINYDEFELMMLSAGRDRLGFSHVVDRHIRMRDVAKLISDECTNFVDRFCREHVGEYLDLPHADEKGPEHKSAWFDTYKQFTEEAELTMQNVLVLWGVACQKSFDDEFLEALQQGRLLDDFLKLTEYEPFIGRMRVYVQQRASGAPLADVAHAAHLPRPTTPHTCARTQQRLAELDQELGALDSRRNGLLAERRRLIGCEVGPVTTSALRRELEALRWKEEVGFD